MSTSYPPNANSAEGALLRMARAITVARWRAVAILNDTLRRYLAEEIEDQVQPVLGLPSWRVADELRRWAADARIENLAEWLGRGNWEIIDSDGVGQAFSRACATARRGVVSVRLKGLIATRPAVAARVDDLVMGAHVVSRLGELGPPTFGGSAPGWESLRYLVNGALWAPLFLTLSEEEGERWLLALATVWVESRARDEEAKWGEWQAPALVSPMINSVVRGHGGQLSLIALDDVPSIPTMDRDSIEKIIERAHEDGYAVLRTPDAWRGLSLEICKAHDQRMAGLPNPHKLIFKGGYRRMAEEAGAAGGQAADNLRRLVLLQSLPVWTLPDNMRGGLLIPTESLKTAPGQQAVVVLELGEALCFGYVSTMQKERGRAAEKRRLVPWIPPPSKGTGKTQHWGAQAAFQALLLSHMRDCAGDLADGRGVELSPANLRPMADLAQLPRETIQSVIDWLSTDAERLKRISEHRYSLADRWKMQLDMMIDGARQSRGRTAGARQRNRAKA